MLNRFEIYIEYAMKMISTNMNLPQSRTPGIDEGAGIEYIYRLYREALPRTPVCAEFST